MCFTVCSYYATHASDRKHFVDFLSILKKKISLMPYKYLKLLTSKNVVTWIFKRSCFRTPFDSQRVNGSQTLLKAARQHFYFTFSSIWDKLSWKTSLLVTSEILRLFVNTMTADHKYFRNERKKFLQPVQIQLSKKPPSAINVWTGRKQCWNLHGSIFILLFHQYE